MINLYQISRCLFNSLLSCATIQYVFFIIDQQCTSNIPGSNKRCLMKDEVGPLSVRMNGGNPCFAPVKGEGVR